MEMLAKTSGGRWGTLLSASWTEQAYLGQHHCNPLLIVGASKTANAGSPVSEKNSSRRLGEPSAKGDDVRSGLGLPCRRGGPARVNIESLRDLVNQYMMQMYYFYALKAP